MNLETKKGAEIRLKTVSALFYCIDLCNKNLRHCKINTMSLV